MTRNAFGGKWTQDKLLALQAYLKFYTTALKGQRFKLVYIDCFAGTGAVKARIANGTTLLNGSARVALDCEPPFHEFQFIEFKKAHMRELEAMCNSHPRASRCHVHRGDASKLLPGVLNGYDWRNTRGVLFLDPFGLQCDWRMLQQIASTRALDVFFWVSLSGLYRQAALNAASIDENKAARLTAFLGTDQWKTALYTASPQSDLFDEPAKTRDRGWEPMLQFTTLRLQSQFPYVSEPVLAKTPNGAPLYALYFCVSSHSDRALKLASKVSRDILAKLRSP